MRCCWRFVRFNFVADKRVLQLCFRVERRVAAQVIYHRVTGAKLPLLVFPTKVVLSPENCCCLWKSDGNIICLVMIFVKLQLVGMCLVFVWIQSHVLWFPIHRVLMVLSCGIFLLPSKCCFCCAWSRMPICDWNIMSGWRSTWWSW